MDLIKEAGKFITLLESVPTDMLRGAPTKKFKVFCSALEKIDSILKKTEDATTNVEYMYDKGSITISTGEYFSINKEVICKISEIIKLFDIVSILARTDDKIEIELCMNGIFENKLFNKKVK